MRKALDTPRQWRGELTRRELLLRGWLAVYAGDLYVLRDVQAARRA